MPEREDFVAGEAPVPDPLPASSPRLDPGRALSGREIALAAGVVMGAFILSGILGLARQIVLASAFGAGRELDAFYAALRPPETLFTLVAGGALGSAFIPVFSRFLNKDDFEGAWRLASAVLTLLMVIATALAIVIFLLAEPIVDNILLPGAGANDQALTVELMRIMLATVVLFGVSGMLMGILNAHQHFLAPALAPSMYNVGIILGAIFLEPSLGIHGLAWGAVLGAGLHLGVQLPSLARLPYFKVRAVFQLKTPGVIEVLSLMGPRLLGLMVVQINFWVNIALASTMSTGSLTALATAFTLMFTVLGVLGQSLGTAVFPSLSALYAQEDMKGFQRTLSGALRNVLFLSIPAGLGMAILSQPIVAVLFERGEWSAADTSATAWALVFYGIGLMGHAALEILARTFYALHDTWTPVVVGGIAMALNVVLSLLFVVLFEALGADSFTRGPFGGLALANSLATAIESTVLWVILQRRIPEVQPRVVVDSIVRTAVAALVMVGAVGLWLQVGEDVPVLVQLVVGIGLGAGVFWAVAMMLGVPEAQSVPRQILSRLKRS